MAAASGNIAVAEKLERSAGKAGTIICAVILLAGGVYAVTHLMSDLSVVKSTSFTPYLFLVGALFIALDFEVVNGLHDTANAVATVIYTHSLEPRLGDQFPQPAIERGREGRESSGRLPCLDKP